MNNNSINYFHCIFIVCLLIIGCDSVGDCFEGTGEITTDERYPGDFTNVLIEDDLNLNLIQNNDVKVEIVAGKNLIDEIRTTVADNTLHLANENVCKWARSYEYEINSTVHFKSLSRLIYKGSGQVMGTDTLFLSAPEIIVQGGNGNLHLMIDTQNVSVKGKSGAGDVILTGNTDTLKIDARHAGLFDFSGLMAGVVTIHHAGTNNIIVHPLNELHVNITYIGNVWFTGEPEVLKLNKTGKGQLLKK